MFQLTRKIAMLAGLSLAALGSSVSAVAAPVTQCGPTICYSYDDAQGAVSLFGLPTLTGDSLVFLPPSFRAESNDGAGTDIATANFIFTDVSSLNGVTEIQNIAVVEFGDYEITNGDSVSVDLLLTVVNKAPGPVPPFFIPEIGSDLASFDALGGTTGLQTWNIAVNFNAANGFEASSQAVSMTLQNTLTATTDAFGETAWIQKKVTVTASVVPVPAAVWLFVSGLGVLGWMRKRA